MKGLTIKEIKIGDKAYFQKTITETDVYLYAGITGDLNPAHINQVESEKTMFQGRIAHGMLTAGLVSAVLGMQLPGPGSIYLGQELKFTAPVKIGDTIKAEVEVIERIEDKNRIKLSTTCTNQDGVEVLKGIATIMPPK
ncbi:MULTISPECIES: MaoC family dehydratase [Clostridium]|uniref:3-hydroxybutyryl-CoA dehydratase n=2 Tax=Clostridium TaxID=1485 RepID=A0A1S9MZR7_CLOBE|nr:MaoC family dehydratase [Clostridium beijerinckii]NOW04978.1 3-hydroxybutyryl-CoA dehydratase [Clostridium beijerinckii]NRT86580.1 3-hydroxybutyryl-CoA dehydratase [Clostridium beijerinckii]NYC01880.1 3-hydroxybutyryl-CoA dehydratase [Clostridium beijerinckii]NYC72013.1 3-hydroxybutyryl-CoA dehydratase [Clostridium beijerinckii]OOP70774.1 enoyl-CoA hydratase [Clostridium beijerinckii]